MGHKGAETVEVLGGGGGGKAAEEVAANKERLVGTLEERDRLIQGTIELGIRGHRG